MERTCDLCVNRFLCPTRKKSKPLDICDGYNEKDVFIGLLELNFAISKETATKMLTFVDKIQGGKLK